MMARPNVCLELSVILIESFAGKYFDGLARIQRVLTHINLLNISAIRILNSNPCERAISGLKTLTPRSYMSSLTNFFIY